jgi:hypothetical protein
MAPEEAFAFFEAVIHPTLAVSFYVAGSELMVVYQRKWIAWIADILRVGHLLQAMKTGHKSSEMRSKSSE